MTTPKVAKTKSRFSRHLITRLILIAFGLGLALALGWQIQAEQPPTDPALAVSANQATRLNLLAQVETLTTSTDTLTGHISSGDMTTLKADLSQIRNTVYNHQFDVAQLMLADFVTSRAHIKHIAILMPPPPPPPTIVIPTAQAVTTLGPGQIPILIYHKPPADLEAQLQVLKAKGYTTVRMAQVAAHLRNGGIDAGWPAKPVAITFDDGFSQQMSAFALLQKYHMSATFYLIVGHPTPGFCLGLSQDKTAPCADSYLTWDQAKTLVDSGLIEIGDHTMDHLDLSKQTADIQSYQILEAKGELESRLGVTITSFAYPYGSYNATTISILAANGFTNAVTTNQTMSQSLEGIFTLGRVRNTYLLP